MAALLHDVGHFTATVTGQDLMAGTDNRHSETGAAWLSQWFGVEVTEPVRLHVDAKRYLCASVPGYAATLSPASLCTLGGQGGPMQGQEFARFEVNPYAAAACRVRRWDDAAKDPEAPTPAFDHFRPVLRRLAGAAPWLGSASIAERSAQPAIEHDHDRRGRFSVVLTENRPRRASPELPGGGRCQNAGVRTRRWSRARARPGAAVPVPRAADVHHAGKHHACGDAGPDAVGEALFPLTYVVGR